MDISTVKEYLVDFQKKELIAPIERELTLDTTTKIKSVIGPRRAGKTYFLYQQINRLLKTKKREQILYLNFEDPRLTGITTMEMRDIIKLHWELYPGSLKDSLHLFIDEPQNILHWEVAVRALYDEGFLIYLSGSSSKLLSKEIATSLRGRTLSYTLLPFSFREFLSTQTNRPAHPLSSREKAVMLGLLEQYLSFGGFPEIVLEQNSQTKIKILQEYFNLVVYRDIVERYKIRNTNIVKWLIKSVSTSFAKESSVHKLYKTLQSQGVQVSKNTLYSYVSMLEDAFFVFFLPKWSASIRKQDLTMHKVYLCDVGFSRLIETSSNMGQKMENAVFLELLRRKSTLTILSYWKNLQQEEVDFVVQEQGKISQLIQVCFATEDFDTKKRELRALLKAAEELQCKNLLVITKDKEGSEKVKGKNVQFVPLWKWLLGM